MAKRKGKKWQKVGKNKWRRLHSNYHHVKTSKGKLILTNFEISRGKKRNKKFWSK